MIKVNVLINNNAWKKHLKNPEAYLKKKIRKLNKKNFLYNKKFEFSLLLSDEKILKKLNYKFRKKNKTTDVLSFPSGQINKKAKNSFAYIGDLAINLNKIKNNLNNNNFYTKFNETWVHSLVHLLGYKHKSYKDFIKMKKIEKKFLKSIN